MECLIGEALSPCQRGWKNPIWLNLLKIQSLSVQMKPSCAARGRMRWLRRCFQSPPQPCSPVFSVHLSPVLQRCSLHLKSCLAQSTQTPIVFSNLFTSVPCISTPIHSILSVWCIMILPKLQVPVVLCSHARRAHHWKRQTPQPGRKQSQCWDTFPEGKASTLILWLLVCFLVVGNFCFFSSFPPNWQQASSAFPLSSWGSSSLCPQNRTVAVAVVQCLKALSCQVSKVMQGHAGGPGNTPSSIFPP